MKKRVAPLSASLAPALLRSVGVVAFAVQLSVASANGQEFLFPPEQFGRAYLTMPQNTAQLQNVLGRNANFERLSVYREDDRFRLIAKPVGRLDLLVTGPAGPGVTTCTASILDADHIITNSHCTPVGGTTRVNAAKIIMDFYTEDDETGVRTYEVEPRPVESDRELDFAILRVKGNPAAVFGRIRFEARDPQPGESLLIIHHPAGLPKHMTRGGCRAASPRATTSTDVRHRCDTLPGSSGSPILAESTGRMVGLHYAGSSNPSPDSYNFGKRLSVIAEKSRIVRAAIRLEEDQQAKAVAAAREQDEKQRIERERAIEQRLRAEFERRLKEQTERERQPIVGQRPPIPALLPPPTARGNTSQPTPGPSPPATASVSEREPSDAKLAALPPPTASGITPLPTPTPPATATTTLAALPTPTVDIVSPSASSDGSLRGRHEYETVKADKAQWSLVIDYGESDTDIKINLSYRNCVGCRLGDSILTCRSIKRKNGQLEAWCDGISANNRKLEGSLDNLTLWGGGTAGGATFTRKR